MENKTCICGTVYKHDREHTSFSGTWGKCPTCALAKALGYEIQHTDGGYDSDTLEWVKIEEAPDEQ